MFTSSGSAAVEERAAHPVPEATRDSSQASVVVRLPVNAAAAAPTP